MVLRVGFFAMTVLPGVNYPGHCGAKAPWVLSLPPNSLSAPALPARNSPLHTSICSCNAGKSGQERATFLCGRETVLMVS